MADIGNMFDRIAKTYDSLNHLFSLGIDRLWRRRAAKSLTKKHAKLLDVSIGTGDLAMAIIKHGKADFVTGIDLSEEMMRIGKRKVEKKGYIDRISFQQANAEQMPFRDGAFSAVTCGFGVRNFKHIDLGLSEMYRVLQQDGELVILEFAYPPDPVIRFFYDLYFTHVVPRVGNFLSKDASAYTYLNSSVKQFPKREDFEEKLRQAGFRDVNHRFLSLGIAMVYTARK